MSSCAHTCTLYMNILLFKHKNEKMHVFHLHTPSLMPSFLHMNTHPQHRLFFSELLLDIFIVNPPRNRPLQLLSPKYFISPLLQKVTWYKIASQIFICLVVFLLVLKHLLLSFGWFQWIRYNYCPWYKWHTVFIQTFSLSSFLYSLSTAYVCG